MENYKFVGVLIAIVAAFWFIVDLKKRQDKIKKRVDHLEAGIAPN